MSDRTLDAMLDDLSRMGEECPTKSNLDGDCDYCKFEPSCVGDKSSWATTLETDLRDYDALRAAAIMVTQYAYGDDDEDVQRAMDALRAALEGSNR